MDEGKPDFSYLGSELVAWLATHKRSEIGMVATIVIVLPCAHEGGDLIVKHGNKIHRFFGSKIPDVVTKEHNERVE